MCWAVALGALLAVLTIAPVLQTWVAQRVLARQPGLRGSIEALSARFGKVQVGHLHLEREDAVLNIPYLEAQLPLTRSLWNRNVKARSLVARGWTLDLSRRPVAADAPAQGAAVPGREAGASALTQANAMPAQKLLGIFREILSGGNLPCDLSCDEIDLEGDVLFAGAAGAPPAKAHVIIKGDGVGVGRAGDLSLEAMGSFRDPKNNTADFTVHGRLVVTMDSPRTVNRIAIKADLAVDGRSLPKGFVWTVEMAAARGTAEELYTLDLSGEGRRFLRLVAHAPAATGRLVGTWKIDLRNSDLIPFLPNRPLPTVAADGEGDFDVDAAFTRVHALGRLNLATSRWGAIAPSLDFLGAVTMDARFDLVHSGQSVRVEQLNISAAGPGRAAVVRSLQPFEIDERSGRLTVADPRNDWLEVSVGAFSLAGLPEFWGGCAFAGGDATGELVVRTADAGFIIRSKAPVVATKVSVQRANATIGRDLDLSAAILAEYAAGGWRVEFTPLTVVSAGQPLATIAAKASWPAKAGAPAAVDGTWNADLKALASQTAIPGLGWITAQSAAGEFSASFARWTNVKGKLAVVGPAADQTISAEFQADVGAGPALSFRAPIKIALGANASELTTAGTWTREAAGDRVNMSVSGKQVALEHLQSLVAPLTALGSAPSAVGAKDRIPFWGDWIGNVSVAFDRLRAGDRDFDGVRGVFGLDHRSIRLQDGLWMLADHKLAKAEGLLAFDPAAELPYSLQGAAALGEIDAAPLFGAAPAGRDAAFKGRFSVATTLRGNGANLDDLLGRMEQEFRLASKNGIVRLLKTNVAETIPEPSAPMSDALDTMGELVGKIFSAQRNAIKARQNHVSKNTRAVLDFNYLMAEIGYDQIAITAIRKADGTFRLTEIAMNSRDISVTGTGEIAAGKGQDFPAAPLSVQLQFGFRNQFADRLATAGLLSAQKDEKGYALLNQPVHFGGTLQHIDLSQWRDLLAKAAAKPDDPKQDGPLAAARVK